MLIWGQLNTLWNLQLERGQRMVQQQQQQRYEQQKEQERKRARPSFESQIINELFSRVVDFQPEIVLGPRRSGFIPRGILSNPIRMQAFGPAFAPGHRPQQEYREFGRIMRGAPMQPQQPQQQQPQDNNHILQSLLHQTLLSYQPHVQGNGGQQLQVLPATETFPPDTSCPICLCTPTENQDPWTKLPCCRVYMHIVCAKTHLHNDRRCPMCRKDIL